MPTIHWGMNQHGKALDELGFVILIIIVMISIVILKNFHSIFFQWEILMVTHLLLCLYPDRPSFMHPIVPRPQKDEFLVLFFDNTQRNRKQQLSQKVLWCGLHFEKNSLIFIVPSVFPLIKMTFFNGQLQKPERHFFWLEYGSLDLQQIQENCQDKSSWTILSKTQNPKGWPT